MIQTIKLSLILLFISISAKADFYSCSFTEPFFSVLISTSSKIVTISSWGSLSRSSKIKTLTSNKGILDIKLDSGDKIKLNQNIHGSDGMSDKKYPYDIKFNSFYGGCYSEKKMAHGGLLIERWGSYIWKKGLSFVNFWPGEYGYVSGYKVKKNYTIPSNQTWRSVKRSKKSSLSCSLKKGKLLIPSEASKREIYASLYPAFKTKASFSDTEGGIKVGDELDYISYYGEGFCVVEHQGQLKVTSCPDEEPYQEKDSGIAYGEIAPYGDYVFTKCQEGHYTWIYESQLEDESVFKYVNLGF